MTDIRQQEGTCERCWGKAFTAAYGIGSKTQAGEYERIVASCACTQAQRRGVTDSFAEGYAARDAEIASLRARVEELEGMVPRWAEGPERYRLEKLGWSVAGGEMVWHRKLGDVEASWHCLMVPPIPLPETKA